MWNEKKSNFLGKINSLCQWVAKILFYFYIYISLLLFLYFIFAIAMLTFFSDLFTLPISEYEACKSEKSEVYARNRTPDPQMKDRGHKQWAITDNGLK